MIQNQGNSDLLKQSEFRNQQESTSVVSKNKANFRQFLFIDSKEEQTVYLNEGKSSFLEISQLPEELANLAINTFDQMWKLHPPQRHKIIKFQEEIEVNRYSQCYLNTPTDTSHITSGKSYMYSSFDTSQNKQELPAEFKPFLKYMQDLDPRYNQVIVNWYEDGNDYIAPHSDCQIGMVPHAKICLISVYPTQKEEQYRCLELAPKKHIKSLTSRCIVKLPHASIVTMCGHTQDHFKHRVPKYTDIKMPRISISLRQIIQT